MISLISFIDTTPIPREQAEKMGLICKKIKVGIRDGVISEMGSSGDRYTDDPTIIKTTKGGNTVYTDCTTNKTVENYYLYDKIENPTVEYVDISGQHLVDILPFMKVSTLEFKIGRSMETDSAAMLDLRQSLQMLEDRTTQLKHVLTQSTTFNQKCNVQIGGGLLTTFNQTIVVQDYCTDELQNKLGDGWRIIAACVQPDQRRPDYVLGRYNDTLGDMDAS